MMAGIQRLEKYVPMPIVSSTKEILIGTAGSLLPRQLTKGVGATIVLAGGYDTDAFAL